MVTPMTKMIKPELALVAITMRMIIKRRVRIVSLISTLNPGAVIIRMNSFSIRRLLGLPSQGQIQGKTLESPVKGEILQEITC